MLIPIPISGFLFIQIPILGFQSYQYTKFIPIPIFSSGIGINIGIGGTLEKCILELGWTATIEPRQIECYGFFLLDHNGHPTVYRLVFVQPDGG